MHAFTPERVEPRLPQDSFAKQGTSIRHLQHHAFETRTEPGRASTQWVPQLMDHDRAPCLIKDI
jgi:hypothetical protein